MSGAIVLLSGGQDSCTCLAWAQACYGQVEALIIQYGQRHAIEVHYAQQFAAGRGVPVTVVELGAVAKLMQSALTDHTIGVQANGGLNGLPSTFTPGRNLLFLTVAAGLAVTRGYHDVVIGVCETDFSGYPDCRQDFITAFEETFALAVGGYEMQVQTPLMSRTKAETWDLAEELGCVAEIRNNTLTCYEGIETMNKWGRGCAVCPACRLRAKGYDEWKATPKASCSVE